MQNNKQINRRIFIASSALSAAAFTIVPRYVSGGAGHTALGKKLNIAAIAVILLSVSVLAAEQAPLAKLQAGQFAVAIGEQGLAGELQRPDGKILPAMASTAELRYGSLRWPLNQPASVNRTTDRVSVEYKLSGEPEIHVNFTYRLQVERDVVVLVRQVEIRASAKLKEDLTVVLPNWPGVLPPNTWLPLSNGMAGKLGEKAAGYNFRNTLATCSKSI